MVLYALLVTIDALEVLSPKYLLGSVKDRHRAFFEKLGIESKAILSWQGAKSA